MKSFLSYSIVISPIMFVAACEGVPWDSFSDLLPFMLFALTWALPFILLLMIRVFVKRLQLRQQTLRSHQRAEVIASVLTLALMVYPLTLHLKKGDMGDAYLVLGVSLITVPFAFAVLILVWGFDALIFRFQSKSQSAPNKSAHGTR
jgi:hypothetical protein